MTFSSTRFMFSTPGLLKIVSIILFICSPIIFLTMKICTDTASWYGKLFPITTVACGIIVLLFYIAFASGLVKKALNIWTIIDMVAGIVIFVTILCVGIVTLSSCSSNKAINYIPASLGLLGAVALAISTMIIFINWKTERDEIVEATFPQEEPTKRRRTYRKSIHV